MAWCEKKYLMLNGQSVVWWLFQITVFILLLKNVSSAFYLKKKPKKENKNPEQIPNKIKKKNQWLNIMF